MTGDMVAAVRETWQAATPEQRDAGREWYPAAGRMIASIAEWSGTPADRVAAALAALSPRNPWTWNVQDAAAYALAARQSPEGDAPPATTFGANRANAWAMVRGAADWRTSARKVRSFVRNLTGDFDAVTVDTWAIRVATRGRLATVPNDATYALAEEAYRAVAREVGESPATVQAATWIVAQAAGLASSRRGRHDLTLKRGTYEIVAALFGRPYQYVLGL